MKIHSYLSWIGGLVLGMLMFQACSDDDNTTAEQLLKVVKTDTKVDYKGGTVTIQTNVEGITAEADDAWLTPTVTGNTVQLTVAPNNTYEARTSAVNITYGTEKQRVPVTQLGIISIANIYSHEFAIDGETKAFVWKTDQEYTIEGVDESWLAYEMKGDSIYFTAKVLSPYDDTRTCNVKIKVGALYNTEATFTQVAPLLPYEFVLGKYTLEYNRFQTPMTTRAEMTTKDKGKTFNLNLLDLGVNLVVLYDTELPGIRIKSQYLYTKDNISYSLAAWDTKGPLWKNEKFGLMSKWNNNKRNPSFTMEPDGFTDETWKDKDGNVVIVRGFYLWGKDQNSPDTGKIIFSTMKLIKTGELEE